MNSGTKLIDHKLEQLLVNELTHANPIDGYSCIGKSWLHNAMGTINIDDFAKALNRVMRKINKSGTMKLKLGGGFVHRDQ